MLSFYVLITGEKNLVIYTMENLLILAIQQQSRASLVENDLGWVCVNMTVGPLAITVPLSPAGKHHCGKLTHYRKNILAVGGWGTQKTEILSQESNRTFSWSIVEPDFKFIEDSEEGDGIEWFSLVTIESAVQVLTDGIIQANLSNIVNYKSQSISWKEVLIPYYSSVKAHSRYKRGICSSYWRCKWYGPSLGKCFQIRCNVVPFWCSEETQEGPCFNLLEWSCLCDWWR